MGLELGSTPDIRVDMDKIRTDIHHREDINKVLEVMHHKDLEDFHRKVVQMIMDMIITTITTVMDMSTAMETNTDMNTIMVMEGINQVHRTDTPEVNQTNIQEVSPIDRTILRGQLIPIDQMTLNYQSTPILRDQSGLIRVQ